MTITCDSKLELPEQGSVTLSHLSGEDQCVGAVA